jgi:putative transposase
MLDFQASPTLPRFAFGKYDEVIMGGISYRATDSDDFGYVFVRTDGTGVAESFTHQELSRRVTLGNLEHRRDGAAHGALRMRSATWFRVRTVTMIASPGNSESHHWP